MGKEITEELVQKIARELHVYYCPGEPDETCEVVIRQCVDVINLILADAVDDQEPPRGGKNDQGRTP